MKRIDFYFDVVSPFVHLAFEQLPQALAGITHEVRYHPVLLAAMLQHWGQKGPAEIETKRAWTYRHVGWLAHQHGVELQMPLQHPFNPLALLRLGWACAPEGGTPNRYVCEKLLHHVWHGGAAVDDAERMAALERELAPARDARSDAVKGALREATDDAIARGAFGVPTMAVDDRLFWGVDAMPMLAAYLRGDAWFDSAAWNDAGSRPPGVQRKP
jgi:2-hydroxychromene-2-carboxylate isomerase